MPASQRNIEGTFWCRHTGLGSVWSSQQNVEILGSVRPLLVRCARQSLLRHTPTVAEVYVGQNILVAPPAAYVPRRVGEQRQFCFRHALPEFCQPPIRQLMFWQFGRHFIITAPPAEQRSVLQWHLVAPGEWKPPAKTPMFLRQCEHVIVWHIKRTHARHHLPIFVMNIVLRENHRRAQR